MLSTGRVVQAANAQRQSKTSSNEEDCDRDDRLTVSQPNPSYPNLIIDIMQLKRYKRANVVVTSHREVITC
jgi:hypothetical protein